MDSNKLIGEVQKEWEKYKTRNQIHIDIDSNLYKSFYNGWLHGRIDLAFDDSEPPIVIDSAVKNITVQKQNGAIYVSLTDPNYKE